MDLDFQVGKCSFRLHFFFIRPMSLAEFRKKGRILPRFFKIMAIYFYVSGCAPVIMNRGQAMIAEPIHANILLLAPDIKRFQEVGPFEVTDQFDRDVTVDLNRTIVVDHFAAKTKDPLPLVIICHGNFSGKNAHRDQARQLASWGFHVVTMEVPNRDQWLQNGEILTRFTEMMHRLPLMLGSNVDSNRIIVVGHSFGGSAAVVAIGRGAPVIGAVLLDPAVVHPKVVTAMKRIELPLVLLGSDRQVFLARGRSQFSKNMAGEMLEVSVPQSTHDDAQGPSMFSRSVLGVDPYTSNDRQKLFGSLLTVAVIGMSTSGTLDFARQIFFREAKNGTLKTAIYQDSGETSQNLAPQ
jgi:dienelactone hydrolase